MWLLIYMSRESYFSFRDGDSNKSGTISALQTGSRREKTHRRPHSVNCTKRAFRAHAKPCLRRQWPHLLNFFLVLAQAASSVSRVGPMFRAPNAAF